MDQNFLIIFLPYFAYTSVSLYFGELFLSLHLLVFAHQTTQLLFAAFKINKSVKYDMAYVTKTHVFVIPSYMASLQDLNYTISFLATHSSCSRYIVVLAMEEFEPGSVEKALILVNQYKHTFMDITYTVHTQHLNEIPELISNANSAIRTIAINLKDDDIVTIMRHDVLIPEKFVSELDIRANNDDIFAAPIIYDQNPWETPVYVCVHDFLTAIWRIPLMMSGTGFPMHVYSMSMALIKKTGYWDTGRGAIAHDVHMFLKTSAATDVSTVMIPVPVNMKHDGNNKYMETLKHNFGILDIAYAYHTVFQKCSIIRSMCIMLHLYELYMFPIINIQTLLLFPNHYVFHSATFALLLFKVACYETIRFSNCNALFNRDPRFRVVHSLTYPLCIWFVGILYTVIPFFHVMILLLQGVDTVLNS
jgi:hypothetical protein